MFPGLSIMFFGEFEYRIDEKGRVPLPPHFREELEEGLVLTPGIEKCVSAYTASEWKKLSESLTTSPLTPAKMRRLNRAIFATAFHIFLDRQGRITLPPTLRQYAEIGNDVVIAGANRYLEIWNKEKWQAEKAESQEQSWQIIESMEKR